MADARGVEPRQVLPWLLVSGDTSYRSSTHPWSRRQESTRALHHGKVPCFRYTSETWGDVWESNPCSRDHNPMSLPLDEHHHGAVDRIRTCIEHGRNVLPYPLDHDGKAGDTTGNRTPILALTRLYPGR
jgi:hypothetical protein